MTKGLQPIAGAAMASLATGSTSRENGQRLPVPITKPSLLPPAFQRATDRDIPDRVIASWRSTGEDRGSPLLRRPLTDAERSTLEARRDALADAVAPALAGGRNELLDAISAMLGGWQSMGRSDPETALAIAASYLEVVRALPHWAIVQACEAIRGGKAGLNRSFCPSEAEFADVVRDLTRGYRERLADVSAVLAAQALPPMSKAKPTPAELQQRHGQNWGMPIEREDSEMRARALQQSAVASRVVLERECAAAGEPPPSGPIPVSPSLRRILGASGGPSMADPPFGIGRGAAE